MIILFYTVGGHCARLFYVKGDNMYQVIVKDFQKKKQMPKKMKQLVCIMCAIPEENIVRVEKQISETSIDYVFYIKGV